MDFGMDFGILKWYFFDAGELGPADEYSARVDIEVDSPGPSHVIQSVALRARSGTPRVHAPKDLQVMNKTCRYKLSFLRLWNGFNFIFLLIYLIIYLLDVAYLLPEYLYRRCVFRLLWGRLPSRRFL